MTTTPKWLVYFQNQIVGELVEFPIIPQGSLYSVIEDTPENRLAIASWVRPPSKRQIANAEFMKLPDAVRGAFAVAWVAINSRLDARDKAAALAYFDTLVIPDELLEQASIIRDAISAS